jgi:hypothetical protein
VQLPGSLTLHEHTDEQVSRRVDNEDITDTYIESGDRPQSFK